MNRQQEDMAIRVTDDDSIKCIVCGAGSVATFLEIESAPVQCNVLWETRKSALEARSGSITLGYCDSCGHIANTSFQPELMEYSETYENSLHFSPRFQQFLSSLIRRLDNDYQLRGKRVIDIGCGKGEFLHALCEGVGCSGTGFDRSYEPDLEATSSGGVDFVVDFYSEAYAGLEADLLTCRHVLEHIDRPVEFLSMIRRTIGERRQPGVFFEVPNALYTLEALGIWDIIYEHVSYFTPQSLATLFRQCGFSVTRLESEFDNQYLTLDATPFGLPANDTDSTPRSLSDTARLVEEFSQRHHRKLSDWRNTLETIRREGSRAVIWGTGSKGVTFLNGLGIRDEVPYAVDINPRKTGMFVPGTGQEIVVPEFLATWNPDIVIIMNPIYTEEISHTLRDLRVDAQIVLA
jgi:SAM-dependent methyltransferase